MLQGEHSAILLTFIKVPFVIKIFVLSIFEWSLYTSFIVHLNSCMLGIFACFLLSADFFKISLKTFLQECHQSAEHLVLDLALRL